MAISTAAELVSAAKKVAKNYDTLYVYGCFGAPMTSANKTRYTNTANAERTDAIAAASSSTFGFDCSGLVKGLLWGWSGNTSATYGGATYCANSVPDISANTMITKCSDISTSGWSSMATGELLWMSGHVGIYIGDGLAVECTTAWDACVQITAVKNIGSKSGYNSRTWTKHGKLPYVTYTSTTSTSITLSSTNYTVGSTVTFSGTKHYTSANGTTGKTASAGKAKITAISSGAKHPYHVIHTDSTSNVYGWVDAADIAASTSTSTSGTTTHTVVKGDTLSALASKYGTTVSKIVAANKSTYPKITASYIVVGWTLTIPS